MFKFGAKVTTFSRLLAVLYPKNFSKQEQFFSIRILLPFLNNSLHLFLPFTPFFLTTFAAETFKR